MSLQRNRSFNGCCKHQPEVCKLHYTAEVAWSLLLHAYDIWEASLAVEQQIKLFTFRLRFQSVQSEYNNHGNRATTASQNENEKYKR